MNVKGCAHDVSCYNLPMVTRRQITQLALRIAEKFRPERIILFGSYAYGNPAEDSDVDLLVVMRIRGDVTRKASEIHHFSHGVTGYAFPLDVLVRTPAMIERRLELGDFFLREITEKGTVLHKSLNSRMGGKGGRRLRRSAARNPRSQVAKL